MSDYLDRLDNYYNSDIHNYNYKKVRTKKIKLFEIRGISTDYDYKKNEIEVKPLGVCCVDIDDKGRMHYKGELVNEFRFTDPDCLMPYATSVNVYYKAISKRLVNMIKNQEKELSRLEKLLSDITMQIKN